MRPGAIELTVIFFGPTSRASVLAQPITPGRTAFESASESIGSRTELDSMLITRPRPLRSSCGRQRLVSRIAESSNSSTASSTCSSVRPIAGVQGRAAAVVDQDVDPAEGLERPVDQPLEIGRIRHVAAHGEGAEPLGLLLEQVASPSEHRDVRAFAGQRFGDREADARGGAADDRGAVPSIRAPCRPGPDSGGAAEDAHDLAHGLGGGIEGLTLVLPEVELQLCSIPPAPSLTGTPM